MYRNTIRHYFVLLLLILLVQMTACSTVSDSERIKTVVQLKKVFCDHYLVYSMCVKDLNSDGVADIIYFDDSNEVFMFAPGIGEQQLSTFKMHKCALTMDYDMLVASSQLLMLEGTEDFMTKMRLQKNLLDNYFRLKKTISRCNASAYRDTTVFVDSFGDENYDDD